MNAATPFFGYRSGNTLLHRAPALVKLAGMLGFTLAVFSGNRTTLPVSTLALVLLSLIARTSFSVHARNAKIIFWYGIFIIFFRLAGKTPETGVILAELRAGLIYMWQLAATLLAGTLFYETTGTTEIAHALSALQRAIRWKAPLPDIAFLLSLTIGFIPRIFDAWTSLDRAWTARGGSLHRDLPGAWRRTTTLVPLLLMRLLDIASDTDRAIRNRSR